MNQRDAAIDLRARGLDARSLEVRLADVPEIGRAVIVIVVGMALCEERERNGKDEREQRTQW